MNEIQIIMIIGYFFLGWTGIIIIMTILWRVGIWREKKKKLKYEGITEDEIRMIYNKVEKKEK